MKKIMQINRTLRSVAVVALFTLAAGGAHAALEVTAVKQMKPIDPDVSAANTLKGTLSGPGSLSQFEGTPKSDTAAQNPWTGLNSGTDREFLYVQLDGTITFDLLTDENGGVPATKVSLLWGSPGDFNKLELFRNGDRVAEVTPEYPVFFDGGTHLVTISGVVFDKLVFSSATGRSFEFANVTVTPEYTGDLACGDTEGESGTSLRRLNDIGVSDPEECADPIPSRLDFDGDTLTFLADYGVLEGAQPAFAFDVDWRTEWVEEVALPQAIPYVTGSPNPPPNTPTAAQGAALSVHWFGASAIPDEPYLLDSCPGTKVFAPPPDDTVLIAVEFPPGFDTVDGPNDMSDLPGFQYGCLVSREVELIVDASECVAEDKPSPNAICVRVKESGYLRGDWTATRTLR